MLYNHFSAAELSRILGTDYYYDSGASDADRSAEEETKNTEPEDFPANFLEEELEAEYEREQYDRMSWGGN